MEFEMKILDEIKKIPTLQNIPFIMLTSMKDENTTRKPSMKAPLTSSLSPPIQTCLKKSWKKSTEPRRQPRRPSNHPNPLLRNLG